MPAAFLRHSIVVVAKNKTWVILFVGQARVEGSPLPVSARNTTNPSGYDSTICFHLLQPTAQKCPYDLCASRVCLPRVIAAPGENELATTVMLRSHSLSRTARALALGILLLAALIVLIPADVTQAQGPDPYRIVSRDGTTFALQDSGKTFSPSFKPGADAEALVNENVGIKDLKPLGETSPESVIGPDGRTQVTNTTAYPNRAIAHLEVNFPSGSGTCTGFFIDKNRLATAGHCVYDAVMGEWATSIIVYPGRNGATAPYGSFAATNIYTVNGWVNTGNPNYDYGLVKLGSNVGNTVGWFGYGWTSTDSFLLNKTSHVRGYPGDKSYGTLWTMKGKIQQVKKTRLFYQIDTFGGQSGSPHYGKWSDTCNPCAFGIHTYGVGGNFTMNSSTRITQKVFNFLQSAGK